MAAVKTFQLLLSLILFAGSVAQNNSSNITTKTQTKKPGSLRRDLEHKYGYANFVKYENSYLNVTAALKGFVKQAGECGFVCANFSRGFSFNYAVKPNVHGLYACEILATDKYNDSANFLASKPGFVHYGIFVSMKIIQNVYYHIILNMKYRYFGFISKM